MNRTQSIVSAIVVLVVQVAAIFGLTVDANAVNVFVSGVAVLIVTAYSLWKNHNFTDAANEAQKTIEELKALK